MDKSRVCAGVLLQNYHLESVNIFKCMEFSENIYKDVVNLLIKKLLERVINVMVTEGK